MTFDNSKATDTERAEFLDRIDAMVENHGDDDEPNWMLVYKGEGSDRSMQLEAQTYKDAIYEACELLRD